MGPWVPEATLTTHGGPGTVVALSDDGLVAASAGPDRRVIVHNLVSGNELKHGDGLLTAPTLLRFSPDGKVLAMAFAGRPAACWDLHGQTLAAVGPASQGAIALAISHDSKRLATAQPDGTIYVWDIATGKEISSFSLWNFGPADETNGPLNLERLCFIFGDNGVAVYGNPYSFPVVFGAASGEHWSITGRSQSGLERDFSFGGRTAFFFEHKSQLTYTDGDRESVSEEVRFWSVSSYSSEVNETSVAFVNAPHRPPQYVAVGSDLNRVIVAREDGTVFSVRPMIRQDWSRSPLLIPAGALTLVLAAWLFWRTRRRWHRWTPLWHRPPTRGPYKSWPSWSSSAAS